MKKIGVLLIILSLLLTGCSTKTDQIKNDFLEDDSRQVVETKTKQYKVPEKEEYKVTDSTARLELTMNCAVDVQDFSMVNVYEQTVTDFSEDMIKEMGKDLFDGEYTFVKPLSCRDREDIQEELYQVEKECKKDGSVQNVVGINNIVGLYLSLDEYLSSRKEDKGQAYEEGKFAKGDDWTFYDEALILKGEIDGVDTYLIGYRYGDHEMVAVRSKYLIEVCGYFTNHIGMEEKIYSYENNKVQYSEERLYQKWVYEDVESKSITLRCGDNQCKISREDAEKLALNTAMKMGYENMSVAKVCWTMDNYGVGQSSQADGYSFYLQRNYNGLSMDQNSNWWWNTYLHPKSSVSAEEKALYASVAPQEFLRVGVYDDGVYSIDTWAPKMSVQKELSKNVDLMEYAEISQIIKEDLTAMLEHRSTQCKDREVYQVTGYRLRYINVDYEGKSALVPAWIVTGKEGGGYLEDTLIVVNALDGTLIYSGL